MQWRDPEAKTVSMEATAENFNMLFVLTRAELDELPRTETSSSASARASVPVPDEIALKEEQGGHLYYIPSKGWVQSLKVDAIKNEETPRQATLNQRRRRCIAVMPKKSQRQKKKGSLRLRPILPVQVMCLTTCLVWACNGFRFERADDTFRCIVAYVGAAPAL